MIHMKPPNELREEVFSEMLSEVPVVAYLLDQYEQIYRVRQWVALQAKQGKDLDSRLTWYGICRTIITDIIQKSPSATMKTIRNRLSLAYPFKERRGWPYKMWIKAQKELLLELENTRPFNQLYPRGKPVWAPNWHSLKAKKAKSKNQNQEEEDTEHDDDDDT